VTDSRLEVIRKIVEAFNRRDVDAALEHVSEDAEFDWSRRFLDAEVVHGHEGFRRFAEQSAELFAEVHLEAPEEIIEVGDDIVVVSVAKFRGRTSGVDVAARSATVWTVRGDQVTRFRFFQNKQDAFDYLGAERTPPRRSSSPGSG
jgi:ketosteroid isomerase-like protein